MENPAFVMELEGEGEKSKASNEAEKAYSFEEAVALIETGKFHYFLLVVCGLCFTAMAVESFQMGIILPFLQCDLESKLSERGFLTSAGFLGIVFGSHTMGFLADTWGRVKTLRVTLVCSFISTLISACSINIWMLIVLRFVNGFFISGCQGCVFSLVGEFHGQKTRAKHVTLLSAFASCGTLYLPFMGLAILPIQMDITILGIRVMPWRVLIVTNSLISLLAIFGLVFCPESVKFHLIQGRNDEALKTFQKLFHWNTGRPKSEYPVKKLFIEISGANIGAVSGVKAVLELVWKQTISVFYKDRAWHTINICGIMFVINGIGSGIYMWFPTMLNQLAATSEQGYTICETIMMDAGAANSTTNMDNCGGPVNADMFKILIIAGVIFFTMRLIYPFIINTIGQSNILIVTLSLASMVCLGVQWANSFVLSAILLASIMCIGTCGGIVGTITVEYFPTNINAMAVCLVMMVGRLGSVAGSNIMGVLLFNNCNLLFYVNMSILIVAAICSYFLPVRKVAKVVKVVFDPIN